MFVAILTAANLKSVNLVANFNALFVLVQVAIIVVFIFLVVQGCTKGKGWDRLVAANCLISQIAHYLDYHQATIVCRFSVLAAVDDSDKRRRTLQPSLKSYFSLPASKSCGLIHASVLAIRSSRTLADLKTWMPMIGAFVRRRQQRLISCTTFVNTLVSGLRRMPVQSAVRDGAAITSSWSSTGWRPIPNGVPPALNVIISGLWLSALFLTSRDCHGVDLTLVRWWPLRSLIFRLTTLAS